MTTFKKADARVQGRLRGRWPIAKWQECRDFGPVWRLPATMSLRRKLARPSPVSTPLASGATATTIRVGGSERPDCVAGHVGLELRNVGANYPFEGRANSRESSRIPATETVRVLSCGCNSGLNIREDSRTIAFDISTAAAAPGPAGLCGRAKQAAQSRAA